MKKNSVITVNRRCKCISGRRVGGQRILKKGIDYLVHYIYQDVDGEWMCEVRDENDWAVRVRARRFNIAMP